MFALFWIVIGLLLLMLGRRLFWFFVGATGFVAGLHLATAFLQGQSQWVIVAAAVGVSVVGIFVSLFLQRLAVGAAGFVAGGYVLYGVFNQWHWQLDRSSDWLPFAIGGVVGAILVSLLFDWAMKAIPSSSTMFCWSGAPSE